MADEKRENRRPQRRQAEDDGLIKKLIEVNRVSKTVKGGKNMRFAALVIVGDGAGKIGVGTGKAKEVPEAIEKATLRAKKNMISVAVVDSTIPHQVIGKFGRGAVLMMPATEGTGVIAGGRNQEYQNEIPRHTEPRQLRKGSGRGPCRAENGGAGSCAARQERGRNSGLRNGGQRKWQKSK